MPLNSTSKSLLEEARAYWHELSRTTHDPRQLVNLGSVLTSKTSKKRGKKCKEVVSFHIAPQK